MEKSLEHFDIFDGIGRQDHRSLREVESFSIAVFKNKDNLKEYTKRYLRRFKITKIQKLTLYPRSSMIVITNSLLSEIYGIENFSGIKM